MRPADPHATCFDRPERLSLEEIAADHLAVTAHPHVLTLLDGYPEPAMLLNGHRQIVLANDKVAALLGRSRTDLLGVRLGDAFACEHAPAAPAGCGTTEACVMCGAAQAIRVTNEKRTAARNECRISRKTPEGPEALDLRVWTTPIEIDGREYTILAVRDTTDEQRRRVLERLFFHDVLNTAGSLQGLMQVWDDLPPEQEPELRQHAAHMASQVVEEIQAQRDLSAAERGELVARFERLPLARLVAEVVETCSHHPVAEGRTIAVRPIRPGVALTTDAILFRRVLGNLVKNALEASDPGQSVTIWSDPGPRVRVHVHNATVMPDGVRLQVFQRSFSTKGGRGRGVGTYSARLLVEKHLHGTITFVSSPDAGTVFTVDLPGVPPA